MIRCSLKADKCGHDRARVSSISVLDDLLRLYTLRHMLMLSCIWALRAYGGWRADILG